MGTNAPSAEIDGTPAHRWLSVEEVIERTTLSKATIFDLWSRGVGPRRTRVGRRTLVREDLLVEWLDSLTES
jgi:predicted DNA-binding transcriptional regulator AlpA